MLNFRLSCNSWSFSDEDVVGSREVDSHCCGVRKMPQYSLVIYAGRSVFAQIRSYLKRKGATERRVGQVGCLGGSGKPGIGSHLARVSGTGGPPSVLCSRRNHAKTKETRHIMPSFLNPIAVGNALSYRSLRGLYCCDL